MWEKMNKVCSSVLLIVMIVTILPLHIFAVENGATVVIPIGESEGNRPQNNSNNVRMKVLSSITPIYISSGAVSTSLRNINKPDSISSKVEARIQAVDDYNTVVAQTNSFTIYELAATISDKTLFLLDFLEEGSYPLQVVYGDVQNPVTIPLNYALAVVDVPVITYGNISNLAVGTTPFQIVLGVTGYDGNAGNFSFSLLDESGSEIYCTATHMRTYEYDYDDTRITYSVEPQSSIIANMQYSLKISTKSGGLYSNISNISTKVSEKLSPEIAILEVTSDDKEMGGLIIKVGGVNDKEEYTVTVTQERSSSSDNYVYKGTESPVMENGNGIFYITLTKNELVLPLSAYGDAYFYIGISDSEGNGDRLGFYNRDFYGNQYSRLSLDKVSDTEYAFTLTGENMFLDLYETGDLSFTLKKYVSGSGYTEVGTTTDAISKSNYTDNNSIFFKFIGTFDTDEELFNGTTYYIFHEDENLAQTSIISGGQATTLDISSLNINCFDYGTKTFYFNFEQCPIDVTLFGSASTATAQLYDLTTEKIVSETETISGTLDSDGNYEFSFIIIKPSILDTTHDYIIRFVSDGEAVTSDKFSSTYASIKYDDSILFPNSYRIMEPVFAGDTSLVFRFYMSDFKNITLDYFKENPIDIVNEANETSLLYTPGSFIYKDYYWYLTLDLVTPIIFGTYKYKSYNTFKALPSNIPVLGGTRVDSETKTISIIDCFNLSDSEYTAVLYDTAENGYGKLADLTLLLEDGNTLVVSDGLPSDLANGLYTVEVGSDGSYLGTVYLHINWNSDDIIECIIKGYHSQYDGTYYRIVEITYQTTCEQIYIYTNNPGYSHVRYSEDSSFSDATYSVIRQYRNQPFKLSDGNGTKTIYVQFKAPDGKESEIYTWSCEKVDEIIEPSIIDAWVSIDGTETIFIPDNTDFTINVISNSQLSDAYVKFVETDGSIYSEQFTLVYQGPVEKGYLFQKDFNSDDFIFRYYDFEAINCYLTDVKGDEQEKKSLSVMFGELENIYFIGWGSYEGTVYTNQTSYDIKGYASPNSMVTITCDNQEFTATANQVGVFVATININNEGKYRITAQDSEGLTTYGYRNFYLELDRIAPIIDTLKAATADGNIILSWSTSSDDVAYYLIWKDDAAVKRVSDNYTSTNYITAGGIGSTFKVVAVDWAGNQSEAKIVTTGDTEPPTTPGIPTISKRGTKSIAFDWTASTDNVAVHKYEIYRDDNLIDTVGYSVLSYNDTNLADDMGYQYKIYALDRAGNRSDAAEANLFTAALTISSSTAFDSEYIKEEEPDGVSVRMTLDTSDNLYSVTGVVTKLQYKLQTAENWSELGLTGISGFRSGTWIIEELPVGEYVVRFYAIDTEGTEKTTVEVTVEINHDMEPPTATIYTPYENKILSGKDLEIGGYSTDNVEVNRIELSYSIDGGSNFIDIATLVNENESRRRRYDWFHIFDATALPSGETVIKAVAYDGRENKGETTVSFILDNTPPDAPYGFYVSGTDEYIGILWSYPDQELDSDFSEFRVYRADSIDGEYSIISEQGKINYFDTVEKGIAANTRYYYYVTAVDTRGNESEPTATLSGIIETDLIPPTIASYLPRQGEELCNTATISVSLYDNSLLRHLDIKYREDGSTDWLDLATLLTDKVSDVLTYTWDVGSLDVGNYQVKLTAEDISGLTSEQIVTYTIRAYALPVVPTGVSATASGHREIALAWDYTGDASLLAGFRILRKGPSEGEYTSVKYIKDATATFYIDSGLVIGEEFSYKIEAVDKWDATAESSVVSALAPSNDTENPIAVIAAAGLTIAKDKTITLTGSGSTDNDEIEAYSWDFGDGNTGMGKTVSHAYTSAGIYTVTLEVADLAGNTGTDTVTLEVVDLSVTEDMHEITLNIIDSSTADPLEGAETKIRNRNIPEDSETTDIILVTDSDGKASIVLKDGDYSVQTIYDSYLLRTNNISVSAGSDKSITVGMARSNILVGSLTSTEMTLQEIKEAGIDIEDPDNQHVYKFAAVLEFMPVRDQKYRIPVNYFVNGKGVILGYGGGWGGGGGGGGFGGCFGGWNIGIFPISRNVYLIIYGEACWLKEMFHVQLLLTNTSTTDYIEDCYAELTLPEGLSLASMLSSAGNRNSGIQKVNETGTIAEQENATVDWYVRGDKEGEYNLVATVEGTYMPNPEPFIVTYITESPVKVWAGSALHMYVEAEKYALKGVDYTVVFRLENVSDKSVYNLALDILGGRFTDDFSVADIDYIGDLQGMWNNGEPLEIDELKPGTSIEGRFIIKFDADFIEEAIPYMLTNMFGFTREGSTTEIPMTFIWVNNLIGDIFEDTILLDLSNEEKKSYTITKFGAVGQGKEYWQTSKEHIVTVDGGVVTAVDVGDAVVSFYNPLTGETHLYSVIVCDSSKVFWKDGTFYYSNDDKKKGDFSANYLYSDSYFFDSAYQYNHNLAIMSLNLAMSAFARYDYDDARKDYKNKSYNVKRLLSKDELGFDGFVTNSGFKTAPTRNSIGVAVANKKITMEDGSKYTLIALAIRGGGYEREWASNFTVGNETCHQGFREAADRVIEFLNNYITNTDEIEGPVKIWITGFSRGAATANLVAAALTGYNYMVKWPDSVYLAKRGHDVYAYCFETPAGVKGHSDPIYNNIFNIVNPNDPVIRVAPAAWGYGRYGRTFYLPSVGTNVNYANLKRNMLMKYDQLPSVSSSEYTVDDFNMISLDTKRWKMPQDIFLNELIDTIAVDVFIAPDIYVLLHQIVMENYGERFAGSAGQESILLSLINLTWPSGLYVAFRNYDLAGTLISNYSGIWSAHYPELCLAWMQSLTLSSDYSFSGYGENTGYYKIYLNCPVDIEVFDSNSNLIAAIVNDAPVDITDSFVATILDGDGQKIIYLPANGTYSIELTATDSGVMNYSVGEYNLNYGGFSRMVSYYDINIKNGDVFNATIKPPTNADDNTLYILEGESGTIEPSEDMSGSDVEKRTVTLKHSGCGTVLGAGTRIKGEFAKIIAYPDKGYVFRGWYIDNDLQSGEPEYRFCVLSDMVLTAVFEKVDGNNSGSGHNGSSGDSGTSAASGSATEAEPTIEHNDGGSATIDKDGNVEIVPDEGYIVKEIYINGELVTTEVLKDLKPTDKVKVVFGKVPEWVNPFTDVSGPDWFYEAVKYVSMSNLMVGTGSGTFEPNTTLSRAMLVTILWRHEGEPEPLGFNPFTDLTQDWYRDAVIWASENDIIVGYGNNIFAPDDSLTREQMATILYRYSQFKGYDVSAKSNLAGYNDISEISDWALDAMRWANSDELIVGRSSSVLAPKDTATRAEIATVIKRYLQR